MKSKLNCLFECDENIINAVSFLILIPLLIYNTSLYEIVISIGLSIVFLLIGFFVNLITAKFALSTINLPIILLVIGTISILFYATLHSFIEITYDICFSSTLLFLFSFLVFNTVNNDGVKSKLTKTTVVFFSIIVLLLIFSLTRELLITGKLLNGFTEKGIVVFNYKFGEFPQTTSFIFLSLAIMFYIMSCFTNKHFNIIFECISFKNITKVTLISLISSLIFSSAIVLIGNFLSSIEILSYIKVLLPYIFAALWYILINLLTKRKEVAECFTTFVLVFTVIFSKHNDLVSMFKGTFVWILSLILIVVFAEYCCNKYSNRAKLPICRAYAAIITSVITTG